MKEARKKDQRRQLEAAGVVEVAEEDKAVEALLVEGVVAEEGEEGEGNGENRG